MTRMTGWEATRKAYRESDYSSPVNEEKLLPHSRLRRVSQSSKETRIARTSTAQSKIVGDFKFFCSLAKDFIVALGLGLGLELPQSKITYCVPQLRHEIMHVMADFMPRVEYYVLRN